MPAEPLPGRCSYASDWTGPCLRYPATRALDGRCFDHSDKLLNTPEPARETNKPVKGRCSYSDDHTGPCLQWPGHGDPDGRCRHHPKVRREEVADDVA